MVKNQFCSYCEEFCLKFQHRLVYANFKGQNLFRSRMTHFNESNNDSITASHKRINHCTNKEQILFVNGFKRFKPQGPIKIRHYYN